MTEKVEKDMKVTKERNGVHEDEYTGEIIYS
jgi:hypothetical protein